MSNRKIHKPNSIPYEIRTANLILAIVLIIYACFSIYTNKFYAITRRNYLVFTDESAWIQSAALIIAAANLLSVVIDHYDKRNNELIYKKFRKITFYLGWIILLTGLILDLFVFHKCHQI